MEDTIIALLNNNLRVIIPDFGAFIIRQKQPRIIVFNEFLRYNDGILIDFIVKTEGIDHEIAEQRVADFAEDGTKLLAGGRELVIEGLGSLRKDSSGKINFIEVPEIIEIESKAGEPEIPQIVTPEVPAKSKTKTKPKTRVKVKSKKATEHAKIKSPRVTKPLPKPVASKKPRQVIESSHIEPQEAIEAAVIETQEAIEAAVIEPQEAIAAAAIEPQAIEAAAAESKQDIEPASIEHPEALPPPLASVPPKMNEPPRAAEEEPAHPNSTNRILAWVLVILFVNAGILAWFLFRNKTHEKPVKSETTLISDSLYDQLADSVRAAAMDTTIVFAEIPDEVGPPVNNELTPGSRYYIVAGCFRDEVNADTLVSSLKLLGYKAEKFGKIGNLFAVCFASFDNKEKAVDELKHIREKEPSAWMTKF